MIILKHPNIHIQSFLSSVGIINYDGLASSQKRKCLVIPILLFSVIPCFVYFSLLTKAKPEAETSKITRSFNQIKMNISTNQTTKNGKASTWRLDWPRRMSVVKSWWLEIRTWDRQLQTCRQHNSNSNKTSCYHKAHYIDNFWVLGATFDVFKVVHFKQF